MVMVIANDHQDALPKHRKIDQQKINVLLSLPGGEVGAINCPLIPVAAPIFTPTLRVKMRVTRKKITRMEETKKREKEEEEKNKKKEEKEAKKIKRKKKRMRGGTKEKEEKGVTGKKEEEWGMRRSRKKKGER